MGELDSHWMVFREIWYLRIFRKSVEKIRVSLKYVKIKSTFTKTDVQLWYLVEFFFEWEMFQKKKKL